MRIGGGIFKRLKERILRILRIRRKKEDELTDERREHDDKR